MAEAARRDFHLVSGGDDGELFDVDSLGEKPVVEAAQPLYQIYEGSKVVVSKQVGKYWKNRYDASLKAYEEIRLAWEEVYRYYNHSQNKTTMGSPRGVFRRGDSTENIIFSNLNIMLPAVYSRDPDVSVTTNDRDDEDFTNCLQAVLNAIFKRRNLLYAKPKIKKAAGMALLTNFGILKLDWTKKDDSLEFAQKEMLRITNEMKQAKSQNAVSDLYGQLEALEANMEVMKKSGPSLQNVLSHNLIVDPYAELPDGTDGSWMCETVFYPTAGLIARFTKKDEDDDDESSNGNIPRSLLYKSTHKAVFAEGAGEGTRDDGLGLVLQALDSPVNQPISFEEEGRRAYIGQYFTECKLLWDKNLKRVYLFHRDDWTWPLWVWDDPLQISRFFPYFVFSFTMNTGGTVGVGECSYYLDQQDEINAINKQLALIRRSVFNHFYYNSDKITPQEAEQFVASIRGFTTDGKNILGVKAGEDGKIQDCIQAFAPPSLQFFEQLFDKKPIVDSINRISNTSDALRGVQFKTNTNVASVQSYQESMRLSVGAKVDVVEDTVADMALSLAECAVQNYDTEDVVSLVGREVGQVWEQMAVDEFTAKYSVNIVSGSMEKPNSVFRKKEAIEVAQAVGQFARAAPGAVSKIMLRVLEQAFTEVVIKKEDWEALDQEIQATMMKGMAQPGQPGAQGGPAQSGNVAQPSRGEEGQVNPEEIMAKANSLPPDKKQKVTEMSNSGASPQDIISFIQGQTGAA
jgi:hypothetical protein